MTIHELLQSIGIDSTVLVAGGAGGILRALSRHRFKFREMVASPICGALAAAYLTLPVMHYVRASGWPLPDEQQPIMLASAFLIGTSAMWISDIVFEIIIRRFVRPKEPDQPA